MTVLLTRLRGPEGSRLTKHFSLDGNNNICRTSSPSFTTGAAERLEIKKLAEVENIISQLRPNECLATGVFDQQNCEIITADQLNEERRNAGLRSRTKDCMKQPDPGLVLLDHDPGPYMPEALRYDSPADLVAKLAEAIPMFSKAAFSGTSSCSHAIHNEADNEPFAGGGGLHSYCVLQGIGLEEFRRFMEVQLWNNGLGYIAFARNGPMLPRTIVDLSVLSPERLIYEAPPVLGKGLRQDPRKWQHRAGSSLSGDIHLTEDEVADFERRVAEAKADPAVVAEAERLQDEYRGENIERLAKHEGITKEAAAERIPRQALADLEKSRRTLWPSDLIEIQGQTLTATELLARGAEFDNVAMPDPIEGPGYGSTTAKFFWNNGDRPCIHSFAHGLKTIFWLHGDQDPPPKALSNPPSGELLQPLDIDQVKALDPSTFPHQKTTAGGNIRLPTTLQNVKHMIAAYGIRLRYNTLSKQIDITMPGLSVPPESFTNTALTHIQSLATLNDMATANIASMLNAIAADHQINPTADWICSRPWDGKDRLPEFYATLITREDYPAQLKVTLIYRWLLSAVAAALMPAGFHSRGVLVLQGRQSIGKTSWIRRLVSNEVLADIAILLGHHLDVTIKDSMVTAICHWIVEIGEFESTLNRKKDIGRLKGFVTNDTDKLRRLYDKGDTHYPRKTVFCASVNDPQFLIDATGNSRWWVIPVEKIDYEHDVDMQQVFAQLKCDFDAGERWWLTPDEEAELERQNRNHRAVSAVEQMVLDVMDPELPEQEWSRKKPIEILRIAGIKTPLNWQCKECASVLRDLYGDPRKIQGHERYRVPLRRDEVSL